MKPTCMHVAPYLTPTPENVTLMHIHKPSLLSPIHTYLQRTDALLNSNETPPPPTKNQLLPISPFSPQISLRYLQPIPETSTHSPKATLFLSRLLFSIPSASIPSSPHQPSPPPPPSIFSKTPPPSPSPPPPPLPLITRQDSPSLIPHTITTTPPPPLPHSHPLCFKPLL